LSTVVRVWCPSLWEAVDGGGTVAASLTCENQWFSTIHSTYYCS